MDYIVPIIGGATGAALVTGIFSVIKWFLERKAKKADEAGAKKEKGESEQNQRMEDLGKQMDALCVAQRTILYDRIKHLAKTYIKRGHITAEELEDLIAMHNVYHGPLKGNGFLDELMAQATHLQIIG